MTPASDSPATHLAAGQRTLASCALLVGLVAVMIAESQPLRFNVSGLTTPARAALACGALYVIVSAAIHFRLGRLLRAGRPVHARSPLGLSVSHALVVAVGLRLALTRSPISPVYLTGLPELVSVLLTCGALGALVSFLTYWQLRTRRLDNQEPNSKDATWWLDWPLHWAVVLALLAALVGVDASGWPQSP